MGILSELVKLDQRKVTELTETFDHPIIVEAMKGQDSTLQKLLSQFRRATSGSYTDIYEMKQKKDPADGKKYLQIIVKW